MRRYAVTVCRNCGTEYNSTREICPGFKCFEETPDPVTSNFVRRYRTGPVISDPDMVDPEAGGTNIAAPPVETLEGDDEPDDDEE